MIVGLYQNEQRSLSFILNSISRQTRRTYHLKRYHSQTSTNGHLSTMATYLQWALFTSRWTVHTFNPILTALQQQQPLKHVPVTKITSCQLPVNQQLINCVYKHSIPTAHRLSLFPFGFCLIE